MIARLSGQLAEKYPQYALVDVGGVGYRVFIPLSTYEALPGVGEAVRLHVSTQVREDAIHLYGFHRPEEKELFVILLGVTGIGSKLALSTLSALSPEAFAAAVAREDVTALSRISGVGRRIAQRLIMELKEKVEGMEAGPVPAVAAAGGGLRGELASALVNLGYRRPQVEAALNRLFAEAAPVDLSGGLRAALQLLAGGG